MTLVSPEIFTGVHGALSYDGAPIAYSEFNAKFARETIEQKRGGKYSNLQSPGKFSITGSITRYMLDGSKIANLLTATATTGTAEALHAGLTYPTATTGENITDMTDTSIATPSKIRLTALTAAITTAGTAILYGTDAASNAITDIVAITTLAENAYVDSSKAFKALTHIVLLGVNSATGTLKVDSITGTSAAVVALPKYFTLTGTATKGSSVVTITLPRCFLTSGQFVLGDASAPIEDKLDFACEDADNATVEYA